MGNIKGPFHFSVSVSVSVSVSGFEGRPTNQRAAVAVETTPGVWPLALALVCPSEGLTGLTPGVRRLAFERAGG